MGTSLSRTLSQQLPQLAGGFGAVGAVVGVLAGVGIPLLAFAFSDMGREANEAKESIDNLLGATRDLEDELALLKTGLGSVEELRVQASLNALIEQRADLQERINALDGVVGASTKRQLATFDAQIDSLREQLRVHASTRAEIEKIRAAQKQVSEEHRQSLRAAEELSDAERLLGEQMEIAARQAANMKVELEAARDAAMAAAAEFVVMQGLRSRFAGEDALMGMPVTPSGRGGPDTLPGAGGGAGRGAEDTRLEDLVESLKTERELVEQFRAEGLELLASASEAELEALGGINEAKLRLEEEYQNRLAGIKQKGRETDLSMTLGAGAEVLGALGQFNDKALKLAKVAGAAQALVSTFQGAAEALKLPYPYNLVAAATVAAKGLSLVAAIKGVSSSGGGGAAGGGGTASAASAATPSQSPLDVRLSGLGPGDSITGSQLSGLFDRLQDEAGDRGLNVSFAT